MSNLNFNYFFRINLSKFIPFLLILATFVSISPFVNAFSPIKGNLIFLFVAVSILLIKKTYLKVSKVSCIAFVLIFLTSLIPTLYWQQPKLLILCSYWVLSIFIVTSLNKKNYLDFIKSSSILLLVTIIGAIFGTIYALLGGHAILDFPNPDGRLSQLFITTLTNFQVGNFIRPSGFFDEPGALSFFICFVAACRHQISANKFRTWMLLVLGLITTSVAHLLYVFFHLIEEFKHNKNINIVLIFSTTIICSIFFIFYFYSPLQSVGLFFIDRFSNGNLGGDRSETFTNALGYLDFKTFLFGINGDCAVRLVDCGDRGYLVVISNPLTPIVEWGIFLAWPYYLSLFYLLFKVLRSSNFIALGMFLLLLQRPYTMNIGYSLMIVISFFVLHNAKSFDSKS